MKYFLTTAIDFVNSRPHLGTAYEKITADIIARYRRLAGFDTHFLMGNDEHSQNVFRKAAEQGKDPLAYCDEMEQVFRDVWKRLDVSFDDFIRTTDRKRHFPAVQKMAQACLDNGDIYEGAYEGWYCDGCEAFKPEKDLVDGLCPIHKTKPQWIKEKNWFFRLSKYQQPLLKHYADNPSFIEPEIRRNEILRLVEGGLEDISMSRAGQSWGIPVPFDPDERRLRVVRRADQLRGGGRLRLGRRAVQEVVAGQPAHRRQGHHALPLRDLAGDADERAAAAAGAGVRPRLGVFQGRAHEQDDGQHRRSARCGRSLRPRSAAPVPGEGDSVRRRRRLHLGALRGEVQRRPGEQPRQPGESRRVDDRALSAGTRFERPAAARWRRSRPSRCRRIARRWTCTRCTKARRRRSGLISAANNYIAETQPWALAKDPAKADQLNGVLADTAEAVRIAATLLSPIMPSSATEILRRLGDDRPLKRSTAGYRHRLAHRQARNRF